MLPPLARKRSKPSSPWVPNTPCPLSLTPPRATGCCCSVPYSAASHAAVTPPMPLVTNLPHTRTQRAPTPEDQHRAPHSRHPMSCLTRAAAPPSGGRRSPGRRRSSFNCYEPPPPPYTPLTPYNAALQATPPALRQSSRLRPQHSGQPCSSFPTAITPLQRRFVRRPSRVAVLLAAATAAAVRATITLTSNCHFTAPPCTPPSPHRGTAWRPPPGRPP